ncbi:MAG: amidohydrolase family protein [Pseudomonadota bacterium]
MIRWSARPWLAFIIGVAPLWAGALPAPVDGTPVRGLWWNPERPGQGIDLHRTPGTLRYSILWYGHDAAGAPTWYFGEATLADGGLTFEMLRFTWPPSSGQPIGSLTIDFEDHEHATLTWAIPERVGTERMVPFTFAAGLPDETVSGLWADRTDTGWGLSISAQGPWTVAIHYHYDDTGSPSWVIGQSNDPAAPLPMLAVAAPDASGFVRSTRVAELSLAFEGNDRVQALGDLEAWPVDARLGRLTEPLYRDEGHPSESGAAIAFVGVNVLPMDVPEPLVDQVVTNLDARIRSVAPRTNAAVPQGTTLLRAPGAWLMPGLVDSHVHLIVSDDHLENDLFTIIANGVTTVRQMWGQAGVRELRDAIDAGDVVGPRILTASPGIEGPQSYWPQTIVVTDATEARSAVRTAAADGFDFIKVYSRLSVANYEAIIEEASAAGIPVVGHVSGQIGIDRALAGHHTIEHLDGYAARVSRSGMASWAAPLSASRVGEMAAASAAFGVWNVPTQVVIERSRADVDRIRNSRDWRLLSPAYREWFDDPLTQPGSPPTIALDNRLTMIRALWDAGAPLAVGTDAGVQYVLPGPSIHEELAHFRAAGIPAFGALQAATWHGARMLGREANFGRVVPGLSADLLLLADDPRLFPSTFRASLGVMVRGRWWSRAGIDARLAEIEASYPP